MGALPMSICGFIKGESEPGGELKVWHHGGGIGVFGGSCGSRILGEGELKVSSFAASAGQAVPTQ